MTDAWVERGERINTPDELREYLTALRIEVYRMRTGLERAALGALTGRPWDAIPIADRPDDIRGDYLEMTVTQAGMAARDAVYRQALAALVVSLDAVGRAALTAWLANHNAADPDRRA